VARPSSEFPFRDLTGGSCWVSGSAGWWRARFAMTETLLGVSPSPSKDPADPPSAEELAAAKELVCQERAAQGWR
jgi:hypothetical protein